MSLSGSCYQSSRSAGRTWPSLLAKTEERGEPPKEKVNDHIPSEFKAGFLSKRIKQVQVEVRGAGLVRV